MASNDESAFDRLYRQYSVKEKYNKPENCPEKYPPDWGQRKSALMNYHDHTCARCRRDIGRGSNSIESHLHHLIPLDRNGTHHLENLVPLCKYCHAIIHPDNDELADWRKAPLFPAQTADPRVAVERLPQTDAERTFYEEQSTYEDWNAEGDQNAYARSDATTETPASIATTKENPTSDDLESIPVDRSSLTMFCRDCGRPVRTEERNRCSACYDETSTDLPVSPAVAAGIGLVILILIGLAAFLIL